LHVSKIRIMVRFNFIVAKHFVYSQTRTKKPVAILAAFSVTIVYELAFQFGWWKLKKMIAPWMKVTDLSFVFGPFIVGTIWVFHLTYKLGFVVYMCSNIALDAFFAFVFLPFLEKIGVVKLLKISRLGIYGIMLFIALFIYPYQKWLDGIFKHRVPNDIDLEQKVE
jgi:hypothetical protein